MLETIHVRSPFTSLVSEIRPDGRDAGFHFRFAALVGLFSGSETALTAASKPLMHRLESRDNKNAGLVNGLRDNKERLIGAIYWQQRGEYSGLGLGDQRLIDAFGEAGIVYATLVMTLLVLIFAEIYPKHAFKKADQMAYIAPVVNGVVAIWLRSPTPSI